MTLDFTHCNLGAGVRLHLCETDKFNTVTLKMFIQQDLAPDSAAATAIILHCSNGISDFLQLGRLP